MSNKKSTIIFDPPHIPDQSTLRPYQEECIKAIEAAGPGAHLCVLATGLGKCFAPGTRVRMYDGSVKNIEDIKENEKVMGPDETPRTVIGLTHGFDDMYTVHQEAGMDYTVNSVHILSLKAKERCVIKGKKYLYGDTVNIEIGDYLRLNDKAKSQLCGWQRPTTGSAPNDRRSISFVKCMDISIEYAGKGEYHGFELIGPDRLFLLEDFTVVHNTYIFSHLPRKGRVLILSHREELVHQPEKYFDCSFGIEQGKEKSNGEEVVSASVQTLVRRLHRFDPYDFDTIITDEAHHAVAPSYQKIYDYFKPRVHLGFTATPDRADKNDLNKIFDDIIYTKDIRWAIKNKFLTDIDCIQVDVGFDLRGVHKQMGDYKMDELSDAINQPEVVEAVADAYKKYAKGQTLIFAANVAHANNIAKHIPEAVVVTGDTPNRSEIINKFTERKIPCLINCMVFTEGTDIPLIETVIMARPTSNQSLYNQAVGRGLRLYPGKEMLTLIDCVGVTGKLDICTAPTLFGLGTDVLKKEDKKKLRGKLTEMGALIQSLADNPASWIKGAKKVNLFAEEEKFNLDDLCFILMPDNSLRLSAGNGVNIIVPPTDARGNTRAIIKKHNEVVHVHNLADIQSNITDIKDYLETYHADTRPLWDRRGQNRWGGQLASVKQMDYIKRLAIMCGRSLEPDLFNTLSKEEAGIIIERFKYELEEKRHSN